MLKMQKKTKKVVAGVITATALGAGSMAPIPNDPITYDQYKQVIDVMQVELEQEKLTIPQVESVVDFFRKAPEQVKDKPVSKNVIVNEVEYTPLEYTELKNKLADELDQKRVIDLFK